MKIKTSVTLSEEIVYRLDQLVGPGGNRSAILERALAAYLTEEERRRRDAQDLEILDRETKKLNKEAQDVLGYQDE